MDYKHYFRLIWPAVVLIASLCVVGLLLPSLFSDDSNLLIRSVLFLGAVAGCLSARALWREVRR